MALKSLVLEAFYLVTSYSNKASQTGLIIFIEAFFKNALGIKTESFFSMNIIKPTYFFKEAKLLARNMCHLVLQIVENQWKRHDHRGRKRSELFSPVKLCWPIWQAKLARSGKSRVDQLGISHFSCPNLRFAQSQAQKNGSFYETKRTQHETRFKRSQFRIIFTRKRLKTKQKQQQFFILIGEQFILEFCASCASSKIKIFELLGAFGQMPPTHESAPGRGITRVRIKLELKIPI